MLPLNLLRIAFARNMSIRSQRPDRCSPLVGKETREAKGLQQGFALQKHLVLATTATVSQALTGPLIDGMPQPAGLPLLAHKAPHFIDPGVRAPVVLSR